MDNQSIATIFREIGDILDIQGANRFRIIAYQKAAQNIENLPRELNEIYRKDPKKIQEIPGIGKDLAFKIVELLTTGKCEYYENILKTFDRGLLEILRVRGVGPKKVKLFYAELQIDSIEKLRAAAQTGKIRELPGMGEKSETEILKALEDYDKHQERMLISEGLYEVNKLIHYLQKCPAVKRVEYAGSLRRMRETVGDLDILVAGSDVPKIMDFFVLYPETRQVLGKGPTKTSILLKSGVQADLRVIDEKVFGAAMHYFTGSKAHNIVLRDRAKKMGLKVSEYGVFKLEKVKGKEEPKETLIAGKTEEEVFKSVGLPYIIPEMREDRGEIEAALEGKLPKPIELKDLRGDLHVHSKWTDGQNEIEEMARAYRDRGFDYIALTDHSPSMAMTRGLTPERFELQWAEIDEINADLQKEAKKGARPFKILKGVECDIKADGSMDLPDSTLKKMDIVIASVHTRFNLSEKEQTERVLKAFQNPYVKIFGHPSGRLINKREPYEIDMEKIIDGAIRYHVALEIDGQPHRLDLFDYYCKMAKERGAKFTIDADAHHHTNIDFLKYGIAVAKRGWVEKKDVLNTLPLKELFGYWEEKRGEQTNTT
jgi:DNA polymerase (family 10)